ncbi:hypothetical protein IQ269_18695 [Tychonema sp. LEGE 07199]|uniref:hypothetical protein n=1 Tax=unclassified Tychonema TaxID=2642144 RepID=UPI00187FADC2|nr:MULTISPECIES: hypothetical protein [unclassified Tychonema]MBE9122770.1 hypothetical protein [Tychonema sp. LEGE 07199]MBE9134943.1 hypothetical protein [Tychonema sp. LEGE 07196]
MEFSVNSQQSTVNSQQLTVMRSATGIDMMCPALPSTFTVWSVTQAGDRKSTRHILIVKISSAKRAVLQNIKNNYHV